MHLIILNRSDTLLPELKADLAKQGGSDFTHFTFYKVDVSQTADVEKTWADIINKFGQVHILINNAAIAMGKRVDELKIGDVQEMMNINFVAYTHFIIMFLGQSCLKTAPMHRFQIVNIGSIAGHMACSRNSVYCASKYAITGFVDALRQELLSQPQIALTNFYPYYINTGLFSGFKPLIDFILPTLDKNNVADRMYEAIMAEEKEVFIQSFIFWFKVLTSLLPLWIKCHL